MAHALLRTGGVRFAILGSTVLALVACSSGQLGHQTTDSGTSPGSVTFRLLLPSTRSFCDQLDTCQFSASHISFSTTTGQSLQIGTQFCATICSAQCTPSPCPGIPCAIGGGVAVTTVEQTWDGSYYESSTCGQGMACVIPRHVPPGHYVARVCATPGTLAASDGGPPSCTATGPQECVDVPFDLPGPSPIEVSLPDVAP